MSKELELYKKFIDGLVEQKESVTARWIMEDGFPKNGDNEEENKLLQELTPEQKRILAKIVQNERIGGMHDALAYMDEMMDLDGLVLQQEGVEYPHDYFESMHFDFINLVEFLADQNKEEITLSEIFAKIGLDKQNWDFHQTAGYLEFTHSNGVEMDFHFAIDVITDLAAILLECSVSGSVNLKDLDDYNTPSRRIRITATVEEHHAINKALADFAKDPLSYDLHEMMSDDEIKEMAEQVEALRKELYEEGGKNRNFHIKAEEMKELLPDWEGADGCIATNRIMVEGNKVGYCYREEPDNGWDSGWRFTAGDESDE